VSGGYPVGGSFSRSALNHGAGAVTRASGAITGLAVLAFLPFAGILEPLPKAVLATIVITAVLGLIRLRRMVVLWRVSRPQFAVAWTTFVLTLVLAPRVERAVMAGVALALAVHLVRELTMRIETTTTGDTLEVRPTGVLWFATAQDLEERLIDLLEEHRDIDRLRLCSTTRARPAWRSRSSARHRRRAVCSTATAGARTPCADQPARRRRMICSAAARLVDRVRSRGRIVANSGLRARLGTRRENSSSSSTESW